MIAATYPTAQEYKRLTVTGSMNPLSLPGILEIASASPTAARLLLQLMRNLADKIEEVLPVPLNADTDRLHTAPDTEAMARLVAEGLSVALRRHMTVGRGHATNGLPPPDSAYMLENTSEAPSQMAFDYLSGERTGESVAREDGEPAARRHLQLRLLGTPEITLDGVRLESIERSNRVGLIPYILALHPGGLSGERLASYLASDSLDLDAFDMDATIGLSTVRTFIWRLRKIAGWRGIVVSPGEHGGCPNAYRLPAETSCDLWEFERNLDESTRLVVQASMDSGANDRAAARRQEAILLYRGDFCKGVGAGCISYAAQQLRSRYLHALLQQATYWKGKAVRLRDPLLENNGASITTNAALPSPEEQSAWLEALSNYRLAVQAEPYDEAAYVGAMQCLAHLGNSKGVQQTFARCSRVIKAELDRSPLATTMQAARRYMKLAANEMHGDGQDSQWRCANNVQAH